MIVRAAVKIYDKRQEAELIIPCHRHCDAFQIIHDFGYRISDFKTLEQGFLDEHDNFYDRVAAHKHAWVHKQLPNEEKYNPRELFSENLW